MKRPLFMVAAWVNFYLVLIWMAVGTVWAGAFIWLFLAHLALTVAILLFADWVWRNATKEGEP